MSLILRVLPSDSILDMSAAGMYTTDCGIEGWGNEGPCCAWFGDGVGMPTDRTPPSCGAFAEAGYGDPKPEGPCVACSDSAFGDWDGPNKFWTKSGD